MRTREVIRVTLSKNELNMDIIRCEKVSWQKTAKTSEFTFRDRQSAQSRCWRWTRVTLIRFFNVEKKRSRHMRSERVCFVRLIEWTLPKPSAYTPKCWLIPTWLVFNHLSCIDIPYNLISTHFLCFLNQEKRNTKDREPDEITYHGRYFSLCNSHICHWSTLLLQVSLVFTANPRIIDSAIGYITFLEGRRKNAMM